MEKKLEKLEELLTKKRVLEGKESVLKLERESLEETIKLLCGQIGGAKRAGRPPKRRLEKITVRDSIKTEDLPYGKEPKKSRRGWKQRSNADWDRIQELMKDVLTNHWQTTYEISSRLKRVMPRADFCNLLKTMAYNRRIRMWRRSAEEIKAFLPDIYERGMNSGHIDKAEKKGHPVYLWAI